MNNPDPLALPPATGGRFGLLILATVTSAAYLYSWIARWLPFVADADRHCAERAGAAAGRVLPDALVDWYTGCSTWASLREAIAVAGMLGVLILVVVVCHLVAPSRIRRGLQPLAQAAIANPEAARRIREQVGDAVEVYVDHGRPLGTRAFGRRAMAIGQSDFDDPKCRPIVEHELGHLRNRDVDLTGLTTVLWWCFLGLAALPALLGSWGSAEGFGYYVWRLALLLALVYALRCQVIRAREFYADRWCDSDLIAALNRRGPEGEWWHRRFHPRRASREAALADPAPLFRLDLPVAAAAGVLVGLAYRPGYHFVSMAWPSGVFGKDLLCGLLFGGFAAAVLAGSTWRATLWFIHRGHRVRAAPTAFAFTASLLAGDFIAPAFPGTGSWAASAVRAPGPGTAVAAVLAVGVWLFVRWVATAAGARVATGQRLTRKYHTGLALAALTAGVWLGIWFRLADVFQLDPAWQAILFGLGASAFLPIPLVAVWLAGVYAASAAGHGEIDRDLRAPWGIAGGAAVAILGGYVLSLAADHTAITAALALVDNGASALGLIGYLLYVPAVVIAFAGSLLAGLACAGRHRTGPLLASLVSVLPLLATGMFLVSLMFVTAFDRTDRSFGTVVAGLGGLPGADDADRPGHASLGLMILALYAVLLIVCMAGALLGNLLRQRIKPGPASKVPIAGRRRTAIRLAPLVLATALVAVLGLREWTAAVTTAGLRLDYDTTAVQRVEDEVSVGSLDGAQACGRLYSGGAGLSYRMQQDGGAAGQLAALAAVGMSSTDVVMQKLGQGAMASLRLRELTEGSEAIANMLRYCAAS